MHETLNKMFDSNAALHHAKSNVMKPLLVLCVIFAPLCVFAAYIFPENRLLLILCFIGLLVFTLIFYGYFALTSPDKLQSEEFQLKQQELQLVQGTKHDIVVTDETIAANPLPAPQEAVDGGNT